MSLWTNFRDSVESAASDISVFDFRGESARKKTSGITGAANRVRNSEEGGFNKIIGRGSESDKRTQAQAVQDQIKAYQDQTALAKQQLDQARTATETEKRRVEEKQIRALRSNYRAQSSGLLGVGQPASSDMNSQLGG